MKEYFRVRERSERASMLTGIVLTVALHACGVVLCFTHGLNYLDPPPPESTFVMDFTQEEEIPEVKPKPSGVQPRSENVDKTKPIETVQKSESQYAENIKNNLTTQGADDDFGDVPVPETKPEKKLDPRASFPGMSKKDTSLTAPHSASEVSEQFKAGHTDGNIVAGKVEGEPVAKIKGRKVVQGLSRPVYHVQQSGVVVVKIWVDQYGSVQKAQAGAEGTTVTDKDLWAAARKAAMETHFNQDGSAATLQEGTITYVFNLK